VAYLRPAAAGTRRVRNTAGAPTAGTTEVQTLTIGGTPDGGSMTFTFRGRTTAAVEWTATDATLIADVDAALEALDVIGTGGITAADGTLTSGIGTITLTFAGTQAKKAQPPGVDASFRADPIGSLLTDTTNGKLYITTTTNPTTWAVVGSQS
jgi:hypothetical protein